MQKERPNYPVKDVEDILVGRASRQKNWVRIFLTLACLVIMAFIIIFVFFGDYTLPTLHEEEASDSVTIDKMLQTYEESPEEFKKTYMKKTLKISGRVYDFNKRNKYIIMTTLNGDNTNVQVIVSFADPKDAKRSYSLMTGEKIEVSGRVTSATNSAMQITADLLTSVEG